MYVWAEEQACVVNCVRVESVLYELLYGLSLGISSAENSHGVPSRGGGGLVFRFREGRSVTAREGCAPVRTCGGCRRSAGAGSLAVRSLGLFFWVGEASFGNSLAVDCPV